MSVRKDGLSAILWDLRAQYEEGLRALTGAQRALDEWEPDASGGGDRKAFERMRDCFSTLARDNKAVATVLREVTKDLRAWAHEP
jgi:hypothetical protein